uniref:Uncharacterized protein n=1 Tax=Caenorhabditis japonica TaxID=281687 RepID=A0A8R1EV39_CAEJA
MIAKEIQLTIPPKNTRKNLLI